MLAYQGVLSRPPSQIFGKIQAKIKNFPAMGILHTEQNKKELSLFSACYDKFLKV